MSEEEKQNKQQPVNRTEREKIQDKDIKKSIIIERRETPQPLSWQPVTDETDSTPPSGGSGVDDNKTNDDN